MTIDPLRVEPPDSAGSDTYLRYCYQVYVTFPYCVDCALGGRVTCVIAEHFEDVAIEQNSTWRFLQIKTRDPGLGPWKLSHLLQEGGALQKLLRTHRELPGVRLTLEAHLEGALANNDPIVLLLHAEGRNDLALQRKIADVLALDLPDCGSFLSRVRLMPNLPARHSIVAHNMRMLGGEAHHLPVAIIENIHNQLVLRIHEAMAGELEDSSWNRCLIQPGASSESLPASVTAKHLIRSVLASLVAPLAGNPQPLLRRIVEEGETSPSVLEQKLLAAGATPQIVLDAKSLRANATVCEAETAAAEIWADARPLDDV